MNITLKRTCTVKPAEPTFKGRLPLSVLDQTGIITHVPTIYYYQCPDQQWLSPTIFQTLESSLSKVLVHFYPFAGRLCCVGNGRMELECDDDTGVELIEAESDVKLESLGDFSPSLKLEHLFPCIDYKKSCIEELPLLYVQVTKFRCGGMSLSLATSHAVADGHSTLHFINEWARIARGEVLAVQPFHDRKILSVYGETKFPPPELSSGGRNFVSENDPSKEPTTIALLKLTKHQVEALKNKANEGMVSAATSRPYYSRYEVITAHMWKTACKARRLVIQTKTYLGFDVDIRRRLNPPLPQGFFGNAVIQVFASAASCDILSNTLGYTANIIHEAIYKVTNDYANSTINFLENQTDLSTFQDLHGLMHDHGPFYGNPNLGVISWLTLPLHDLDFGWGKEIYMSPGIHAGDGDSLILPGHDNDGSVIAAVCLQEACMEDYKKYFYQEIFET